MGKAAKASGAVARSLGKNLCGERDAAVREGSLDQQAGREVAERLREVGEQVPLFKRRIKCCIAERALEVGRVGER